MSRNIWISSDLHYNHANILKFVNYQGKTVRPGFADVDHMNDHLLDKHNSVVKPGDIWYNLGDVFFGDREKFKRDWPKFHGKKRLIVGNHDDIKFLSSGSFFEKILMWRQFPDYNILMSHVPVHESSMYRGRDNVTPMLNVHGHIHRHDSPTNMHYNVSVELLNDYTPIHIEDLAVIARQRRAEWKPTS